MWAPLWSLKVYLLPFRTQNKMLNQYILHSVQWVSFLLLPIPVFRFGQIHTHPLTQPNYMWKKSHNFVSTDIQCSTIFLYIVDYELRSTLLYFRLQAMFHGILLVCNLRNWWMQKIGLFEALLIIVKNWAILYDSICQIQSKISVFSLFILLSEWRIPKIDFLSIC